MQRSASAMFLKYGTSRRSYVCGVLYRTTAGEQKLLVLPDTVDVSWPREPSFVMAAALRLDVTVVHYVPKQASPEVLPDDSSGGLPIRSAEPHVNDTVILEEENNVEDVENLAIVDESESDDDIDVAREFLRSTYPQRYSSTSIPASINSLAQQNCPQNNHENESNNQSLEELPAIRSNSDSHTDSSGPHIPSRVHPVSSQALPENDRSVQSSQMPACLPRSPAYKVKEAKISADNIITGARSRKPSEAFVRRVEAMVAAKEELPSSLRGFEDAMVKELSST